MRATRLGLIIGLVVAIGSACVSTESAPPRSTYNTLMAGWEHHFSFEWAAADQSLSSRKVSGYVYNHNGEFAISLRVLAQAGDSTGAALGQRVAPCSAGVEGSGSGGY